MTGGMVMVEELDLCRYKLQLLFAKNLFYPRHRGPCVVKIHFKTAGRSHSKAYLW